MKSYYVAMKQIRFILIFILSGQLAYSQNKFVAADSIASLEQGDGIVDLHRALTKNLFTDDEKARAFYSWIANHIRYDVAESLRSEKSRLKQDPAQVLKSKKAICHGYSALFQELCKLSGIRCYLVSGYTRLSGRFDAAGHTWNIVYVNDSWQQIDATWGAGGVDADGKYVKVFSENYVMPPPVYFLAEHYPFDPMWQLVACPVQLADYKAKQWQYVEKTACYFNFNDTIAAWEKLDSLEQEFTSALRMVRFSPGDPVIKEQLSFALFTKGNAEFENGNKMMAVVFPRKQANAPASTAAVNKLEKLAQLDAIEKQYKNAEFYYRQVQLSNPSEKAVLKSNMEALKYNRDVVNKAKAALVK